jgi:hypothetical protein
MPSKSAKQKKFMAAAAHSPKFAKKAGIPTAVAKEFHNDDRGKYGHKPKKAKGKTREQRLEGKSV